MRVLLVDDHSIYRGGLVQLFNSQPDFKVVGEAGTIQEAIQQVDEKIPELIIMDFGLPDGSGIEAMAKILSRKPDIQVVFLTIHASDELAFSAIRQGAKGFLLKNIAATKLLAALRGLKRGEMAVSRVVLSRFTEEILPFISPSGRYPPMFHTRLTPREFQVLVELTTGDSNRDIADRLSIRPNTLKVHVHHILRKLGLSSRSEAAEYARRHGIVKEGSDWKQDHIV